MASLHQLRDSLNTLNPVFNGEVAQEEEVFDWELWLKYGLYAIILIFLLLGVRKIVKRVYKHQKAKRLAYENSESFYFQNLMKQSNEKSLLVQLYSWLNRTPLPADEKTISFLAKGDSEYEKETEKLKASFFDSSKKPSGNLKTIKAKTKKWRMENLLKPKKKKSKNELQDLNPQ